MTNIKFQINPQTLECLTPCPYGEKQKDGQTIRVGSTGCLLCQYYHNCVSLSVKCSHPNAEEAREREETDAQIDEAVLLLKKVIEKRPLTDVLNQVVQQLGMKGEYICQSNMIYIKHVQNAWRVVSRGGFEVEQNGYITFVPLHSVIRVEDPGNCLMIVTTDGICYNLKDDFSPSDLNRLVSLGR